MKNKKVIIINLITAFILFSGFSFSYGKDLKTVSSKSSNKPEAQTIKSTKDSSSSKAIESDTIVKKDTSNLLLKDTSKENSSQISSGKDSVIQKDKNILQQYIITEEEELLLPEEGAQHKKPNIKASKVDSTSKKVLVEDTTKQELQIKTQSQQDTIQQKGEQTELQQNAAAVQSKEKSSKQILKVEEPRSINFAKNLKEYRSPKLAMLLSFIIPGLGQAYTKNYLRGGLYLVAEGTIIGISAMFMSKGKNKYKEATNLADKSFSFDKMKNYYDNLYNFILEKIPGSDPSSAQEVLDNIYLDTLKSLEHAYSIKSQEFYSTIKEKSYVQGWDDCQPTLAEIGNVNPGEQLPNLPSYTNKYVRYDTLGLSYLINIFDISDTNSLIEDGDLQYGYSYNQRLFRKLMSQSNDYYKTSTNVLFLILLNHVVSAIDALISAKAYNDNLLGKQSFWQHIEIKSGVASRSYSQPLGLTLKFKF